MCWVGFRLVADQTLIESTGPKPPQHQRFTRRRSAALPDMWNHCPANQLHMPTPGAVCEKKAKPPSDSDTIRKWATRLSEMLCSKIPVSLCKIFHNASFEAQPVCFRSFCRLNSRSDSWLGPEEIPGGGSCTAEPALNSRQAPT